MSDKEYIGSEATESSPKQPISMGRIATRGTVLISLSTVVTKLGGLISLWVLGLKLTKEQFGLWGLALSIVCLVDCVRDMGVHKLLIQRGAEYDQLGSPVFKIGLMFNAVGAAGLIAIAPIMARVYDNTTIAWLIVIAALAIPLQTPVTVLRAKLGIDLNFKVLAVIQVGSQLVKNGSMILFALAGFGAYSFAFPIILVVLFNLAVFHWVAGPLPTKRPLTREHFRSIFAAVKWIAFGGVAAALINQGDRLVIGGFKDTVTVGIYFFGFQLIMSTVQIFGTGVIGVFMPTLSKLAGHPERQARAYERLVRVSIIVFALTCITAAVASDPAIRLLWGGRWDAAIPVAQVMSLGLGLYLLGPVGMAMIEATGRWRLRAAVMGVEMIGVLIAAAAGSYFGGLVAITVAIASWKAAMGVSQCLIAGRITGIHPAVLARSIAGPVLLAVVCGTVSYFGLGYLLADEPSWLVAALGLASFGVLFTAGLFLLMRQRFDETYGAVRHLLPGRAA